MTGTKSFADGPALPEPLLLADTPGGACEDPPAAAAKDGSGFTSSTGGTCGSEDSGFEGGEGGGTGVGGSEGIVSDSACCIGVGGKGGAGGGGGGGEAPLLCHKIMQHRWKVVSASNFSVPERIPQFWRTSVWDGMRYGKYECVRV